MDKDTGHFTNVKKHFLLFPTDIFEGTYENDEYETMKDEHRVKIVRDSNNNYWWITRKGNQTFTPTPSENKGKLSSSGNFLYFTEDGFFGPEGEFFKRKGMQYS